MPALWVKRLGATWSAEALPYYEVGSDASGHGD